MINNLRNLPAGHQFHTDVAIIGGGVAGLVIASELAGTSIRVMVVDSGGFETDTALDRLNQVENAGRDDLAQKPARGYCGQRAWLNDVPAFELRHRGIGGSTRTWIGKCAAFDEIDLEKRSWVPGSGWPIAHSELGPYLDRAAEILNLGPNLYDARLYDRLHSPPRSGPFETQQLRPFFWQFSLDPTTGLPLRFQDMGRRINSPNVDFLTYATATQIEIAPGDGRLRSLTVRNDQGGHATIHAPVIVLCGGGIENARLLLASNAVEKAGLGNRHDVVGRYLADHPRTELASIPLQDQQRISRLFRFYGLADRGIPNFYLHGFSLDPALQRREELLNCAAYPAQTLANDDPWIALKRLATGRRGAFFTDLSNVMKAPTLIAQGLVERMIHRRSVPRKITSLRFDVMTEQRPDPQSRVTLSSTLDMLGTPLAKVDWRIGDHEKRSVRRMAQLMALEFRRIGLPEPLLPDWVLDGDLMSASFSDMAHPSGTTRMGNDVKTSVVDGSCMVHGVEGLFIAGSSVFSTSGHANPTLMIVALSLRLADHILRTKSLKSSSGEVVTKEDSSKLAPASSSNLRKNTTHEHAIVASSGGQ